ncbi:MAG: ATP-grasp domain-containing protein [Clostridiales bacterium]|nr:ATP-grasp domain-containing protein [Clostridiales bacterium]
MNQADREFVPLLFAGDINVYSMARAFHEQYGILPQVYGKYPAWPCHNSKIMHYTANSSIDQPDVFFSTVVRFASEQQGKTVLLIGCGDSYVQLISTYKDQFPENVVAPYIPIDLMNKLIHKEKFYALCEESGVDYPDTFVHRKEMGQAFQLPFEGPFIIKPSNGIEYWRHPFPGQKKVFKEDTRPALEDVLNRIYQSGYDDSIIIQNFIPGDDTYMRVLTNYSDQRGEVKLMCLGHVLLEEHTPHGIGNHAAIITERNEALEQQFKTLLEKIGYVGFSNFDIKYDQRDNKYKVFEINTRQGRSNYYVTGAGANLAQYVVEDWIYHHPIDFRVVDSDSLWLVVPKRVVMLHVKQPHYRKQLKKLIREGRTVNPLYYSVDNSMSRKIERFKTQMAHFYKFWKYYR